jgi:hypothetical protein
MFTMPQRDGEAARRPLPPDKWGEAGWILRHRNILDVTLDSQ